MATENAVFADEMGNSLAFAGGEYQVNVDGTSITRDAGTGVISVTVAATTTPIYQYRDIWAAENAALAPAVFEWGFGDGGGGATGLPVDDGWEVEAMYFHSDVNGAADDVTIDMVDVRTPNAGAPVIATITVTDAGSGVANNAYLYEEFATPIAVPAGAVLGFRTVAETGAYQDARVGARLRKLQANVVTDVTINGVSVVV